MTEQSPPLAADEFVDDDAARGSGNTIRSAEFFLRRQRFSDARLVIDQHRNARVLAQFTLDAIEFVAVMDRYSGCKFPGVADGAVRVDRRVIEFGRAVVLFGLVSHDDDLAHALCVHLLRDLRGSQLAVGWLATRHRNGVVEQDLVRDRHFGCDRRAHCQ